jgi:hypothetical protein
MRRDAARGGGRGRTHFRVTVVETLYYGTNSWAWCPGLWYWYGPVGISSSMEVEPPPCGTPVGFAQADGQAGADGRLDFQYLWASSTGNIQHLNTCRIFEDLSHSPSPWPAPPWQQGFGGNGQNQLANGTSGEMTDSHFPGAFQTTLANASVSTSQVYFYRCTCYDDDAPVVMAGPLTSDSSRRA